MLKKLRFILILCCVLQFKQSTAQNMVIDPSFEDTIALCDYDSLFICNLHHWYRYNTPDVFISREQGDSTCGCNSVVSLNTSTIYQDYFYQAARTGDRFVAFSTYLPVLPPPQYPYIEFVMGKLNGTLFQGHQYCIEFYLNLSNGSGLALSSVAIKFVDSLFFNEYYDSQSTGGIFTGMAYNDFIDYLYNNYGLPEFENNAANYLTDTMNWMHLTGSFIAQGWEKYFFIGAIYHANSIDTIFTGHSIPSSIIPGLENAAYYYLDDVSVTDCSVGIEETMQQEEVLLSPSLAQEYVTIEYKPLAGNPCRMEVFSSMGSRVMQQTLPKGSNKHRLTVSQLPSGVYYVRLQWSKQTAVGRFVKQ